jgi:hypothetical protein
MERSTTFFITLSAIIKTNNKKQGSYGYGHGGGGATASRSSALSLAPGLTPAGKKVRQEKNAGDLYECSQREVS